MHFVRLFMWGEGCGDVTSLRMERAGDVVQSWVPLRLQLQRRGFLYYSSLGFNSRVGGCNAGTEMAVGCLHCLVCWQECWGGFFFCEMG